MQGKDKRTMMKDENRRQNERVQFLRPIMYVYESSDKFIEATMLNHSSDGICFQSTPSVAPGAKICILTDESPVEIFSRKSGEAVTAEVMWCKKKAGAHWVGVQYIDTSSDGDADS